ncbi:MAG TPA: SoxR reducing system RseC family protein [Pseudomonadales bacterium]
MTDPGHSANRSRLVRRGLVVEDRGDVVVRFDPTCGLAVERGAACCRAARACAELPLGRLPAAANLRPGDAVALEVAARPLTIAAAYLFGLPLAALPIAGWLGGRGADWMALPAEPAAAVAGLAGLGAALILGARAAAAVLGTAELTVRRQRTDR